MEPTKPIKTIKAEVEELSVFLNVSKDKGLIDRRIMSNGIRFGSVGSVAKNLGVTIKEVDNGIIASAPKVRLQLFVEKLHFSGVRYKSV